MRDNKQVIGLHNRSHLGGGRDTDSGCPPVAPGGGGKSWNGPAQLRTEIGESRPVLDHNH